MRERQRTMNLNPMMRKKVALESRHLYHQNEIAVDGFSTA